jgi:ABC-type multidrug transport system fused ATPase/permease subunit
MGPPRQNQDEDSCRRSSSLQAHIELREIPKYRGVTDRLIIEDGRFGWSSDCPPVHDKVNIEITPGSFTIIVGPTGSGKSTLLKGILGELPVISGKTHIPPWGKAYCDQNPWLPSGTFKEILTGGSPLDESLYSMVVRACALTQDIKQWQKGDETPIGSNGVALSGGQKQRLVSYHACHLYFKHCVTDISRHWRGLYTLRRTFYFLMTS